MTAHTITAALIGLAFGVMAVATSLWPRKKQQ